MNRDPLTTDERLAIKNIVLDVQDIESRILRLEDTHPCSDCFAAIRGAVQEWALHAIADYLRI